MKRYLLLFGLLLLLVGCHHQKNSNSVSAKDNNALEEKIKVLEDKIEKLNIENTQLKLNNNAVNQNNNHEEPSFVLTEILNTSFKLFSGDEDNNYIESIMSEDVTLEKENNKLVTVNDKSNEIDLDFLNNLNFNNLQYRFFILESPESATIGFAKVENEMNIEIYLEFVKQNEEWKLNNFKTN